jgi:hypothetical protein
MTLFLDVKSDLNPPCGQEVSKLPMLGIGVLHITGIARKIASEGMNDTGGLFFTS